MQKHIKRHLKKHSFFILFFFIFILLFSVHCAFGKTKINLSKTDPHANAQEFLDSLASENSFFGFVQKEGSDKKTQSLDSSPLDTSSLDTLLLEDALQDSSWKDLIPHGKTCDCGGQVIRESQTLTQPSLHAPEKAPANRFLIFVSFSLPEETLKQYYREANAVGGRLVLRGLDHNSFVQTARRIQRLGIDVDIDPPLFRHFAITHVPTFVYGTSEKHDRLQGHVSLQFCLEQFATSGEVVGIKTLLNKGNTP